MKELFIILICAISLTIYQSNGLKLIDVPKEYIRKLDIRSKIYQRYKVRPFKSLKSMKQIQARRQASELQHIDKAKDTTLKDKIGLLIDQTINDAHKEIGSLEQFKMRFNGTAGYRIGYLMYMVKRSRDVMNELFTVAVNHKVNWKALDQLKIFELIIHTNVDTSNLLRQLLDIATTDAQTKTTAHVGPVPEPTLVNPLGPTGPSGPIPPSSGPNRLRVNDRLRGLRSALL